MRGKRTGAVLAACLLAAACGTSDGERVEGVALDPMGSSPPSITDDVLKHFAGHPNFPEMLIALRKPTVYGEQHWGFCGVAQWNRSDLKNLAGQSFAVDWNAGTVRVFDDPEATRLCGRDPVE